MLMRDVTYSTPMRTFKAVELFSGMHYDNNICELLTGKCKCDLYMYSNYVCAEDGKQKT